MGLDMSVYSYDKKFEELFLKYNSDELFQYYQYHYEYVNDDRDYWYQYDNYPIELTKSYHHLTLDFFNSDRDELAYWRKEHELNNTILSNIHDKSFDSNGLPLLLTKENLELLAEKTEDYQLNKLVNEINFDAQILTYQEWY